MVGALLVAKNTPPENVILPVIDECPALVRSAQKPYMTYTVHKPTIESLSCNCVYAQQEYICKHHVNILQLLNPSLAEGSVTRVCGGL